MVTVVAHVCLGDHWLQSVGLELVLAEGSGEEATSVLSPLKVDYVRSAELDLSEDHD